MTDSSTYEDDLLAAFEAGRLKSVATKAELVRLRAAARATASKDKRVNIRMSSVDLHELQAKALQEGLPYQTLIASVLHKYVAGSLVDRSAAKSPSRSKKSA